MVYQGRSQSDIKRKAAELQRKAQVCRGIVYPCIFIIHTLIEPRERRFKRRKLRTTQKQSAMQRKIVAMKDKWCRSYTSLYHPFPHDN